MRRYTAVTSADHLISAQRVPRQTILDTHLPYPQQRWEQGCRNTDQLPAELRERGYLGSARTLRRLTAKLRRATANPTKRPAPEIRGGHQLDRSVRPR